VRLWRQSVRVQPNIGEEHHNFGQALLETGDTAGAVEQFEKAIELKPDFGEAMNSLGLEKMKAGSPVEALELFDRAIAIYRQMGYLDERMVSVLTNRAVVLIRMQRPAEAKVSLEEVLQLNPDVWQARTNLGIILAGEGDLAGAKRELEEAIRLNPDDPTARDRLARIEMQTPRDTLGTPE
jgi:Flp pilus assembly protein TadD